MISTIVQRQARLRWNAMQGNVTEIKRALENDTLDINAQDKNGWTALMEAAFKGNLELVTLLLRHGANAKIRTFVENKTAPQKARAKGYANVAAYIEVFALTSTTAPVIRKAFIELITGVMLDDADIVTAALESGPSHLVDVQMDNGRTALMEATARCNIPMMTLLLRFKPDVNTKDKDGMTSLMYSIYSARAHHPHSVISAVSSGHDANSLLKGTSTVLTALQKLQRHFVAEGDEPTDPGAALLCIQMLIAAGGVPSMLPEAFTAHQQRGSTSYTEHIVEFSKRQLTHAWFWVAAASVAYSVHISLRRE